MIEEVAGLKSFLQGVEAIPDRLRNRATAGAAERHKLALGAKNYLLSHYDGVESVYSFREPSGEIFDCVTFESQPGMRGMLDTKPPVAPDLPAANFAEPAQSSFQRSTRFVPPGTVAMRRVSAEDIVNFGGMEEYFGPNTMPQLDADGNLHYHAVGKQFVDNNGMTSKMSVYKQNVNADKGHIFSLVQSWTTTSSPTQSIELCIMCAPTQYKTPDPVLSIFTTNDDYKAGTIGRDLLSDAFIQTSNKWIIGASISPVSTKGGNQYYLSLSTKLDAGKWWVYAGGEASTDAIGYYPISWFSGVTPDGMAKKAATVQVGGEVNSHPRTPQTVPPMGSGVLGTADWKNSAYVRDVRYYSTTGVSTNATLVPNNTDADKNYQGTRVRYKSPWNETLWFGGPGVTS